MAGMAGAMSMAGQRLGPGNGTCPPAWRARAGSLRADAGSAPDIPRPISRASWSALDLAADELLHQFVGHVVAVLLRRGLHEVRRRREDGPADATVLAALRRPDRGVG